MADSLARLPEGIRVLERGWLSSNNIVLTDGPDMALVDSGYVAHAAQTVALVRHALDGRRLGRLINTHSHSDHIGGNAALVRAFGCTVTVPTGIGDAIRDWDEDALLLRPAAQQGEPFAHDFEFAPGDRFHAGGLEWQCLAAPGHDMNALMFHAPEAGVLISGDALWNDGFGVIFPDLVADGPGRAAARVTLEAIGRLPVEVVIPGHGPAFADVAEALGRAHRRLAAFEADPLRLARHAIKVLISFRMLASRQMPRAEFIHTFASAPLSRQIAEQRLGQDGEAMVEQALKDLLAAGVLTEREGLVCAA